MYRESPFPLSGPSGVIPRGRPVRCAGFSLVSAIFLLVVLVSLGAALVNMTVVQHGSISLDAQGARAYQAARAGIEWGAYQVLRNGSCPNGNLNLGGGLNGFTVSVSCTATAYDEAGIAVSAYRLVATACNIPAGGGCPNGASGNALYAERQLEVALVR